MKVHFIYPDVDTYYYPGVHHGLASLSGFLKANGHAVSLHHVKRKPSRQQLLERISREKPDLVAFTAVTNQIRFVEEWSAWIKAATGLPAICGGIHATLRPDEVIGFEGIDMVCIGEGEHALLDLLNHWGGAAVNTIPNLWIKQGDAILKNNPRPLIACLDDLPEPDYELFDCEKTVRERGGDFYVMVSRGCPHSCSFCCNHALRKLYAGKGPYFRFNSVDHVLERLAKIVQRYDVACFTFVDDVFGLNREWAMEFCRKYPLRFRQGFKCNLRVDQVDAELLRELKRAGCIQVSMGIESGNEWMRTQMLNRPIPNDRIIRAFDMARAAGLATLAFNMIGLPEETTEMMRETIDLNRRIAPDHVAVFFFYPYPETDLHRLCEEKGLLTGRETTNYITDSVLKSDAAHKKRLDALYARFQCFALERELYGVHPLVGRGYALFDRIFGRLMTKRTVLALFTIYPFYYRALNRFRRRESKGL